MHNLACRRVSNPPPRPRCRSPRLPGYDYSQAGAYLITACTLKAGWFASEAMGHPDNFTFGQPVYLSQLYRLAMQQPGVASVVVKRFQRWGKVPNQEIENGLLKPADLEIVQLENDRNFPENGRLEFDMHGGL